MRAEDKKRMQQSLKEKLKARSEMKKQKSGKVRTKFPHHKV